MWIYITLGKRVISISIFCFSFGNLLCFEFNVGGMWDAVNTLLFEIKGLALKLNFTARQHLTHLCQVLLKAQVIRHGINTVG